MCQKPKHRCAPCSQSSFCEGRRSAAPIAPCSAFCTVCRWFSRGPSSRTQFHEGSSFFLIFSCRVMAKETWCETQSRGGKLNFLQNTPPGNCVAANVCQGSKGLGGAGEKQHLQPPWPAAAIPAGAEPGTALGNVSAQVPALTCAKSTCWYLANVPW